MNIIRSPIPSATLAQSLYIKQLDLNDYYVEDRERQIIRCQICDYDVSRGDIFEHTTSKRHKYNKLFVAILKNCSPNKDADFIVLNIDQLQCRYCDFLIINSYNNEHVINHLEDTTHIERKENYLRILDGLSNNTVNISKGTPTVDANLLQSLDSLITHNKKYNKHKKRTLKKIEVEDTVLLKAAEELKLAIGRLQLANTNNAIHQHNTPQSLEFPILYESERGEKLPKCIIMIEGPTCMCTTCMMQVPKSTYNVSGHLNGKKHRKNVLDSMKTRKESGMVDMKNKSLTQSREFSKDYGIVIDKRDSTDTNNIVGNNVPQSSSSCANSSAEIQNEVSNYITIGENGARICKICLVKMPKTLHNINEHLNGKKHMQKIIKVEVSKQEKLKLQHVNTLIPAAVGNTQEKYNELTKYKEYLQKFIESMHQELYFLEMNKTMPEYISKVNNDVYMCTTCVLTMSNNEYYIRYHNESKKHKNELKKLMQPVTQELEIKKKSNTNKKNGNFICISCVVILASNEQSLKQHNEGKNHKKMLRKLIKSTRNKLVSLEASLLMERQY